MPTEDPAAGLRLAPVRSVPVGRPLRRLAPGWRDLARESRAGRLGTFALFFVLAFGVLGFVAKQVIAWILGLQ